MVPSALRRHLDAARSIRLGLCFFCRGLPPEDYFTSSGERGYTGSRERLILADTDDGRKPISRLELAREAVELHTIEPLLKSLSTLVLFNVTIRQYKLHASGQVWHHKKAACQLFRLLHHGPDTEMHL